MSEKKSLSRSEIIRQRRLKQLRQQGQSATVQRATRTSRPKKQKTRGKSSYHELPPITSRGVVNDFGIERRKKTGRRRFNATFALPRIKVRALPLPRIHIRMGWRVLSFFLTLLFGASLYLAWALPEFHVNSAQVTGNQWITADEINSVLDLNGFPIFLLTPDGIREKVLRNYPELVSVEVGISLPNIVTVNVSERQPVILWQQDGGFTWVDETGTAFRPRGEAQGLIPVQSLGTPPEVNVVEANPQALSPFIADETVKAIKTLAPYVPQGTTLLYDPKTGLNWIDGRGWKVIFGTDGDMNTKMLVYQAMVDWLSQRNIRPILINVAYPEAPFYRLEQVEAQGKEQ